ncbi:4Fe-4S binding protein [candidate division KSB1 bacterium]|nr:4Fe-4S binding protein [candidate division KSB1 bacterium]
MAGKSNVKIHIKTEWCKGCVICVEYCPTDVLAMRNGKAYVKDITKCTACELCEIRCPDFAITVLYDKSEK